MNKIIFRQMLPIRTMLHFLLRHYDCNPATFWMYRIQKYGKSIPSFCRLDPIFFYLNTFPEAILKIYECPELVLSVQSATYYLPESPTLRVKGNTPNQQYQTNKANSGQTDARRATGRPIMPYPSLYGL